MDHKFYSRILIAFGLSAFFTFALLNFSSYLTGAQLLMSVYDGSLLAPEIFPLVMVLYLLPSLAITYLLSDYLRSDFSVMCVYIFTRTANKGVWILKKTGKLLLLLSVFHIAYFLFLLAVFAAKGYGAELVQILPELLLILFLSILTLFPLVLLLNFISLWYDPVKCSIVVIGLHVITLFIFVLGLKSSCPQLVFFLPSLQTVYVWHKQVEGYTALYSILYSCVLSLVITVLGLACVKRKDLY